jgi:predicted esterase
MAIYRPMERDPEYRALGSVLADAYTDQDNGHLYHYVPAHAANEKLPLVLFLHGSGGNFKAYFYLWRAFADRHHYAVVCPSFGFGNWYNPGGMEAIERALQHAKDNLPVDPTRVVMVGLSNGGTGVTRVAAAHPDHFAGLVFLSAVIEQEVIRSDEYRDGWVKRPVLIIHGNEDDRISLSHATAAAETMRQADARVTVRNYPQEDHFLLFSQPQSVKNDIAEWAQGVEPSTGPLPFGLAQPQKEGTRRAD